MADDADLPHARPASGWDFSELGAVIKRLDEGLLMIDEAFRVEVINDEGLRIDGRSAADLVGRTLWDLWPRLLGHDAEKAFRLAMRERTPQSLEARFKGHPVDRWLAMRIIPGRKGLACFYRDISGSKRDDADLRTAVIQARASEEATGIGAYELDLDTRELKASENARRLFGLTDDEELTFAGVLTRIHPEDRDSVMITQDHPEDYAGYAEYRVVLRDGSVRWLGRQAGVVDGPDGISKRIVGALRDITARRTSDEQIRFQAQLLDNMGQAVIATDAEGLVVYWNRAAEALYGWTSKEAMGRSVMELKTGPAEEAEAARLLSALMAGECWTGELQLTDRSGRSFLAEVTDTPIFDASGALVGILGVSTDVSRRKRAEEHLNMMVNELNHRVKNTLATVQSVAAQTLRLHGIPAEVREALTARLVALSRAHDVLTNEHWTGGDLRDLVVQAAAPYANGDSTRISFDGPRVRLPPKTAIAIALALHELTTNALKYGALSADGGKVTIEWRVRREGDHEALNLTWREAGGPRVVPPRRHGFGSRLIARSLPAELDGTVDLSYPPDGVICRITAKLQAQRVREPRAKYVVHPDGEIWGVTQGDVRHGAFPTQREAVAFVSHELERLRLTGRGGTVVFQRH